VLHQGAKNLLEEGKNLTVVENTLVDPSGRPLQA
jgi:hypothetical protein